MKTPLLPPRLQQAIKLAFRAHGGMIRKGDGEPYLLHPINVLALLIGWGAEEDTCIAGLLHDVIEDARDDAQRAAYREEINMRFGENVLEIVEGVTEQDKTLPWRTRKERYLEHLQGASRQSLLISCADRIHNTSSLLLEYKKEGEDVWEKFNAGKEEQLWYVKSVIHILEERLGVTYTKELSSAIKEIELLKSEKKHDQKSVAPEDSSTGDPVAQYRMAIQFFYGTGVEKNISTAINLLMKSAAQQFPRAQFHLGAAYHWQDFGKFFGVDIAQYVPHDSMIAFDLFQRAACNGHGMAEMMLAEWYEMGIIVEKNEILGSIWREIANMHGQFSPVKNADLDPSPAILGDIEKYWELHTSRPKSTARKTLNRPVKSEKVILSKFANSACQGHVFARIDEKGNILIDDWSMGTFTEKCFGHEDVETNISIPTLSKDKLLLCLLQESFKKDGSRKFDDGCDLHGWLNENGIEHTYDFWP